MNNVANGAVRSAGGVPRRSFLKIAGASGFALGLFPACAPLASSNPEVVAAAPAPAAIPAADTTGLKPTQQPSAFVRIALDGTTTVVINRLDFGQGVQTALPMILAE